MSTERVTIMGCGYTGLRLVRRYAAEGRACSAFVRSRERARELEALGVTARILDLDAQPDGSLLGPGSFVYMVPPPAAGDISATHTNSELTSLTALHETIYNNSTFGLDILRKGTCTQHNQQWDKVSSSLNFHRFSLNQASGMTY